MFLVRPGTHLCELIGARVALVAVDGLLAVALSRLVGAVLPQRAEVVAIARMTLTCCRPEVVVLLRGISLSWCLVSLSNRFSMVQTENINSGMKHRLKLEL